MVHILIGLVTGILLMAWLLPRPKPEAPASVNPNHSPQILHWGMEAEGRRLLEEAINAGDTGQAQHLARHLRDLRLIGFAQGWYGENPNREAQQRSAARWN